VRKLEVWSTSTGRVQRDEHGIAIMEYHAQKLTDNMLESSQYLRKLFNDSEKSNDTPWREMIRQDVIPGLFNSLLFVLPNLQELKIGGAWLMDFPIFNNLLSSNAIQSRRLPHNWHNSLNKAALSTILSRLTVLNVPADMTGVWFTRRNSNIFDFRAFTALKTLGLSMRAMQNNFKTISPNAGPSEIFPQSLEVLQISEATEEIAPSLDMLCCAKKGGQFPALRRVEIYHMRHIEFCEVLAPLNTHPINTARAKFKEAGVALFLYFPPSSLTTWDAGATPWSLRLQEDALVEGENRSFLQAEIILIPASPRIEVEWDKDGDTVMKGSINGIV